MSEWEEAQHLQFGFDLIAAALKHLQFLAEVHSNPLLFTSPVLERAIERYQYCWLPLAAKSFIVPPLDCAWIWHCHRLSPNQYAKDCRDLFGKIIAAGTENENAEERSRGVWDVCFPDEPYTLDFERLTTTNLDSNRSTKISYDLRAAVSRQRDFYYQVSEQHYLQRSFLAAAEKRYKGFLHLVRTFNSVKLFFVPTYDIDLIWHTHVLSPQHYEDDLLRILGKVFPHDDTDSDRDLGAKLNNGFRSTQALWEEVYDKPFEKAGCMYRGEEPKLDAYVSRPALTAEPKFYDSWSASLLGRKIMKVRLSVLDAKNASGFKHSSSFVVLKAIKNFDPLKLTSSLQHTWRFEAEVSTQGVVLYLKNRSNWLGISMTQGKLWIPWEDILKEELQSLSGWFLLQQSQKKRYIRLFVSVTPPVAGPYIFRSVRGRDTDDDGTTKCKNDRWITRTIYDHANNQEFVVRCRYIMSDHFMAQHYRRQQSQMSEVHVHRGGWLYKDHTNSGMINGEVLASALQLRSVLGYKRWSLLNGSVILTVGKDVEDQNWIYLPKMDITGSPIILLPGRKLQFAVPFSSSKQEAGFVTMVRFSSEAPEGVATALFNWRSGGMQISCGENVLLVLLLATCIAMSAFLLESKSDHVPLEKRSRSRRDENDHWGAFEFSGMSSSDINAQPWWIKSGYQKNSEKEIEFDLAEIVEVAFAGVDCGGGCGGDGGGGDGGGGGGCGGGCGGGD